MSEKFRISPWDILEGQKNPTPLSWSWFGAIRVERRFLPFEETHRLLQCHTHSQVKSPEYYLEPLPLPPEDIDPPKPVCIYFFKWNCSSVIFVCWFCFVFVVF